jgi:alpha,alpha-trehalose phosphorylase
MIEHPAYGEDAWSLHERELHLDVLEQAETIFALSNGHIGLRGNLDEGDPAGLPGTYLNGFHENRPLPYAEAGFGYPQSGETIVNVTDGKIIRLLVDDEPFDVRYGRLDRHERTLDFRRGTLRREVEWVSPAGQAVRVTSTRMVSFIQRAVAAVLYEVEPIGDAARVVVQSELVANEPSTSRQDDPRAAAALESPLVSERSMSREARAVLVHRTRSSGLRIGAAMDHVVEGPEGTETSSDSFDDLARVTVATDLDVGQRLRVVKYVSYGWSAQRALPAIADQVAAALAEARFTGWDKLVGLQADFLSEFWDAADVEVDGDAELQQAVRFAMFHVLQAAARAEGRAVGAKGLTGNGYDGHVFWDSEMFALFMLTYTFPQAAKDALCWRHSTIELAQERAAQLGLRGAAFPWRTITGRECSGYWPAGTAAFHINADVAAAVRTYTEAVDDEPFERNAGLTLLAETARLWHSLGHSDSAGGFRIDGVTGPDEYSALADNNTYTNLMAKRNLLAAADVAERYPDAAAEIGVEAGEVDAWRVAARSVVVPVNHDLGIHEQSEGFTRHEGWDFESTPEGSYPLFLHYPYFQLYRRQVVKQADLVLALHACHDEFTLEEKGRNFAYYEQLTVRDSSLSAGTQAVIAAETGHLELALDYLADAALLDLHDAQHNTRNGLHLASLAGSWVAVVAGFGGMRVSRGRLAFDPRLPSELTRVAFGVRFRDSRLRVEITHDAVVYRAAGSRITIGHCGETVTLEPGAEERRGMPDRPPTVPVQQPRGRSPRRRTAVRAS